jgi:GH24 family phage-related lysozyme (muramidase)
MKYLNSYENYNNNLILEKLNIKNLFNKFKNTKSKKIAKLIAISLLGIYSITQTNNFIHKQKLDPESINILSKEVQKLAHETDSSINTQILRAKTIQDSLARYKNPKSLVFSQNGWDQLRYEEGSIKHKGEPNLKAYSIGDGKITIGYGHAENEKTSTYAINDVITKEKANELFHKDVNRTAVGVKRMFAQWETEENIHIKITQEQYDVLISIAYNKGVTGLRNSPFILSLKNNNYKEAAEKIKAEYNPKFLGINLRRIREAEKFLS